MFWILTSAALAGACPWSTTPVEVDAGWKTVTVDGVPYSTETFAVVLADCGEIGAVAKLQEWQSMRKVTLGLGAAGLCLYLPWLGVPVTGIVGIIAREELEKHILDGYHTEGHQDLPNIAREDAGKHIIDGDNPETHPDVSTMAREDLDEHAMDGDNPETHPELPNYVPVEPRVSEPSPCCKRCKAGKPCGDSCISVDAVCSKPGGCACY